MNTRWDERGLVEDLVARGVDDWVDLGVVTDIARRIAPDSGEARTVVAIGIVSIALSEGFVTAGSVSRGGFVSWQLSLADATARIVREWMKLSVDPRPGDIAWLCNTSKGDQLGRAVLERERR